MAPIRIFRWNPPLFVIHSILRLMAHWVISHIPDSLLLRSISMAERTARRGRARSRSGIGTVHAVHAFLGHGAFTVPHGRGEYCCVVW
jgi:hypothetical protein